MAEHIEYQGNFSGSQIDTLLAKIQSSQVFTTEEKTKLASLVNYDDTEVKEDISDIETSLNSHKSNKANPHEVTKAQVGLGNVDNTSDANKPISTATQAALDNKVSKVDGKGLSANDFTDSDKAQISTNKAGIAAVANRGSKNLLPIKNHAVGDVIESNGFRFTIQADGGILIEEIGTHSNNGDCYLIGQWGNRDTLIDCSDGTYTATLEANDDTVSKVSLRIYKAGGGVIINNVYTNTSANFTGEIAFIFITAYTDAVIPSGGVVAYPMIRSASIEDDTYVPYAPTNRELYEMILALQSGT